MEDFHLKNEKKIGTFSSIRNWKSGLPLKVWYMIIPKKMFSFENFDTKRIWIPH